MVKFSITLSPEALPEAAFEDYTFRCTPNPCEKPLIKSKLIATLGTLNVRTNREGNAGVALHCSDDDGNLVEIELDDLVDDVYSYLSGSEEALDLFYRACYDVNNDRIKVFVRNASGQLPIDPLVSRNPTWFIIKIPFLIYITSKALIEMIFTPSLQAPSAPIPAHQPVANAVPQGNEVQGRCIVNCIVSISLSVKHAIGLVSDL